MGTEPPLPHMPSQAHTTVPPQLWLAQSLTASCCNTYWCWSWSPGWLEQGSRSNPINRMVSCSLNILRGQAFKMLRHLRACTAEKEMEAPLTGPLEKDTGSNLSSKHLHMANLRTQSSLGTCLGWEQSLAPMRPSASTVVTAQAFTPEISMSCTHSYECFHCNDMKNISWNNHTCKN